MDESESASAAPVLELQNVSKSFSGDRSLLDRLRGRTSAAKAVCDASLAVHSGETVGVVGESGCGKSTLAKLLTGQLTPDCGQVLLDGTPAGGLAERSPTQRRRVGVVLQHVRGSFDPRWSVRRSLSEALDGPNPASRSNFDSTLDDVSGLLRSVDLSPQLADRYPRALSGGQLQRVALARTLAHDPDVIVLDEPVSGLDVATQATILNLLADVQNQFGVGYVFISHDLDVVRYLADRVAVMYAGEIVESGPATQLFDQPNHPYTDALLGAIPSDDPRDDPPNPLHGDPPDPTNRPTGCSFHPRCPAATAACTERRPEFEAVGGTRVRCLHAPDATSDRDSDDYHGDDLHGGDHRSDDHRSDTPSERATHQPDVTNANRP
ncbi:oligopeptide/dipeptide ABC transporter, ATP-binding protein [Haloferax elongans ATCC BAA-1513]|uniref:Oligopeptide/dipeptide ABC transporter, ATP-binding protein n=1 Tax=Haloferax elongans ATCC BAA-1513 TaxID=1230453 RepID=M0HJC1_HALEO|nr:oligopeptide/dipeptide ABC transporter, ATP-binding protein [Haloferax elongans ATCC BAA-1513]